MKVLFEPVLVQNTNCKKLFRNSLLKDMLRQSETMITLFDLSLCKYENVRQETSSFVQSLGV